MLKYEKAYILFVRGQKISPSMTNTELDYYLQQIYKEEVDIITRWKYYSDYINATNVGTLNTKTIISKLHKHTNHEFPLPMGFPPTTKRNGIIIGYYMMLGWDLSSISFTEEINLSLKKYETAYLVAEFRNGKITSNMKVIDLKNSLGQITSSDVTEMNKFREIVKSTYDYFPEHSVGSLVTHLGITHKHVFPMPSTYVNKNEVILAYYIMKGFDIKNNNKTFTEEQNYVLHPQISGIVVINAGPGTGKTTVANERAYRMKGEGVLLISYTNDAINENYNRLKIYPNMRGLLKKKSYEKSKNVINVTTVDSLAIHIVKSSKMQDNFDLNIINATNLCKRMSKIVKRYTHIIVDESQDIDDNRGKLILDYFRYSGAKSICIFGDPRQRIHENHGGWYSKLWVDGQHLGTPCAKLGFSYSYRFQNMMNLRIANHLSEQRSSLHHTLVQATGVPTYQDTRIELFNSKYNVLDVDLGKIAEFVRDELHGEQNVSFSEIAVVGTSMNKDNATSSMAGKICSVFKDKGIPCYTKSNGSFIPNAVMFTTIHSVKGKEFDHVFIFGSDSFPETFKNIPYESAQSLIYVMHTRARKRMYYISVKRDMYTPVRGLRLPNNPFITNTAYITNKPFMKDEPLRMTYKISELSKEFSYLKFIETNGFELNMTRMEKIKTEYDFDGHILPGRPKEINPRFWGIFCGLAVQLYLRNEYHDIFYLCVRNEIIVVSDSSYNQRNKKGQIVGGRDMKTGKIVLKKGIVNEIREKEFAELKFILSKKVDELILSEIVLLAKIYDFIISGNTQSRYDIDIADLLKMQEDIYLELIERNGQNGHFSNDNDQNGQNENSDNENDLNKDNMFCHIFKSISKGITLEYGKSLFVEKLVEDKYMNICGAIDSVHDMYTLEFKTTDRDFDNTEAIQAFLYSLCNNTEPFLINLQTGRVCYVTSNRGIDQWRHITKSYGLLRTHVDIVTDMRNKQIEKRGGDQSRRRKIKPDMFVIDTEFASDFKTNIIFDIAVINLHDPFRSLVLPINPGKRHIKTAVSWMSEPAELFEEAMNIYDFKKLFIKLTEILGISTAELMYYVCKTDVEWCDQSINVTKTCTNLAELIKHDAKKMGYINLGSSPQLSDYYDVKCHPSDYQDHLTIHTALSDSLMLYELLHLDYI